MHVVAGNHDIGFHNNIRRYSAKRFVDMFQAPSVQHLILKDSHFILINSMALHGDSCELCLDARSSIDRISDAMNCAESVVKCNTEQVNFNYSHPIIMQVSITPETYAVNKCGLPKEGTIILTAIIMIFALIIFLSTKRTIGR
ncbi:Metallophosphoesterase 1 [Papilio machaon]|uniref:Metallophosphoesterase 1 n=1 Tax=Papilio machaon TaxID=76193 RepID=A0A194QQ23_PAPMA|nr:Metallophosphoesterase 1 [Papilio machaon]